MRGPANFLFCCKTKDQSKGTNPREETGVNVVRTGKKTEKYSKRPAHKILLLGTGESGKSTFLKQMRIITGKKFTAVETEQFKSIIYDNIYEGVLFLLQARSTLGIAWGAATQASASSASEKLEEHFQRTRSQRRQRALLAGAPVWSEEEFLGLAPLFQAIWADPSIRLAFEQRTRLITEDFSENTRYYLNRLHQIAVPNYVPTNEDIVWSRRPTDTIIEEEVIVHGTPFIFIDVGGQTKERRKWCQTFTDMTSILFLVGSSHYDELYLDRVTSEYRNKLREAMTVFECLINFDSFRRVSIIIFFNKSDLLKEKVEARISGIRAHFSEFPPTSDEFKLSDVQNFLVESFASLVDPVVYPSATELAIDSATPMLQNRFSWLQRRSLDPSVTAVGRSASLNVGLARRPGLVDRVPRKRTIYRHFTTAVDKNNIQMVFSAMHDTILQTNLRRLMLS